jgi:hypothetical protein
MVWDIAQLGGLKCKAEINGQFQKKKKQ